MTTNVIMPQLGESVVEGTVTRWLVQEGERVEKLAPLLEIATDKVDTEVPSPASGVLLKIHVREGTTVGVGTFLAVIGAEGEEIAGVEEVAVISPAVEKKDAGEAATIDRETSAARDAGEVGFISPVVAKLAAEHDIDLRQVIGTGLKGRIRKQDVLAFVAERQMPAAPSAVVQPSFAAGDEVVPITRMRRLIAEHMVASKRTSPHVTTVFDCDMTAVVRHLYAHRDRFARDGVTLTFTPYFIAAVVAGLKEHRAANASWGEKAVVLHRAINIGLAVAIEDGLIVPVIKEADSLNLLGLARAVNDLSARARGGDLKPDETQGGTFTLTNHGTTGSLFATPIINQPQTGILGVGKIHKAPVVVSRGHNLLPDPGDAIAIHPIVYLSFTFDHRLLDGASADAFMSSVKEVLENWGM
ncbi:MAG: 2-oxo acid dehydrogenase subunit E2 [Caldilineales bacterium]|nr:2-oxo acid dehydrogenase subunit E2 [Caldilineales bacterium]